ncbi:MAG: hypothetical protein LBM93_02715 [Oscillospiraceae bacterium]|jgi:hypothetical protein|nr:hypothetical protein [Oscillospiraceae bacterium]
MSVIKKIFSSFWTRLFVSLLAVPYTLIILVLAYRSIFYTLVIPSKSEFLLLAIGLSLFVSVTMIYTRKQLITVIISIVLMFITLPIILFWLGEWVLIIPIAATALIIFLISGASERTKTIFGALLLLYYIIGALIYYLVTTLFASHVYQITTEKDIVSQSGIYRVYVKDAPNSTVGTEVMLEPNDKDIDNKILLFRIKGYQHRIYVDNALNRKPATELSLEWQTQTREECIRQMLEKSPLLEFDLDEKQYEAIGVKPTIKVKDEDGDTVTEKNPVYLKDLNAKQLDALDIPKKGDVLYIDGKIWFRYISAVVEKRFELTNRELFLHNSM